MPELSGLGIASPILLEKGLNEKRGVLIGLQNTSFLCVALAWWSS